MLLVHSYLNVTGINQIIFNGIFLNGHPYGRMDYPLPDLKNNGIQINNSVIQQQTDELHIFDIMKLFVFPTLQKSL